MIPGRGLYPEAYGYRLTMYDEELFYKQTNNRTLNSSSKLNIPATRDNPVAVARVHQAGLRSDHCARTSHLFFNTEGSFYYSIPLLSYRATCPPLFAAGWGTDCTFGHEMPCKFCDSESEGFLFLRSLFWYLRRNATVGHLRTLWINNRCCIFLNESVQRRFTNNNNDN